MKNLGLAGAIALCGIGLILIGLGNFRTQTIYAAPAVAAAAAVQDDPVIVDFGSMTSIGGHPTFYRLWSDSRIELRVIEFASASPRDVFCDGDSILRSNDCDNSEAYDTGWIELPAPPGGEGYACRSDVNGDRRVDGIDLATLLSQWGDGVSCDPKPSYDCLQLSNLNS